MGVLRLVLGVKILYEPKLNESLCDTFINVVGLRLG
jgi:hypothetical protein